MPSNQSSEIGRRYTHFTSRLGILLGCLLITAWAPDGPVVTSAKLTIAPRAALGTQREGQLKIGIYRPVPPSCENSAKTMQS